MFGGVARLEDRAWLVGSVLVARWSDADSCPLQDDMAVTLVLRHYALAEDLMLVSSILYALYKCP